MAKDGNCSLEFFPPKTSAGREKLLNETLPALAGVILATNLTMNSPDILMLPGRCQWLTLVPIQMVVNSSLPMRHSKDLMASTQSLVS